MSKLPLWLRLALLEIKGDRRYAASFVLSLAIGLIGFLAIDAFQRSLGEHVGGRSKAILSADLAVSGRRTLTGDELQKFREALPEGSAIRFETAMYSMAQHGDATRLVEVRAVDQDFPWYGGLRLRHQGTIGPGSAKDIVGARRAWVYPEIMAQLDLAIGSEVAIGDARFVVTDVIEEDPSASSVGFAIAPKIFIGLGEVDALGLVQKGSRVFHGAYVKLPEAVAGDDRATEELKRALEGALVERDLRVRTHKDASEQLSRTLDYLNDYLGLVALVALFLAAVGSAYLFRGFLERRAKDVAILVSLGGRRSLVRGVYLAQQAILGALATVVTLALCQLVLPILPLVLEGLLPEGLTLAIHPASAALAAALGIGGSVLFCLPLLRRVDGVRPAALFQEAASPRFAFSGRQAVAWIPAFVVYWALACWQAHSFRVGTLFVVLFVGSGAVFAGLGVLMLRLLDRRISRVVGTPPLAAWLAGLSLARRRTASLTSFLALSLGALLIAVVPQVRAVLEHELADVPDNKRPSLFLFDIQDEQLAPLKTAVAALGTTFKGLSPMIRAQLVTINGAKVERQDDGLTREDEQAARSRNRGYNLTYRDELQESETLVAGRPFSGRYDWTSGRPAEISVEQRFGERLGLKLGDRMSFDVQGVEVDAEVVSFRRVVWTSFEPNFFVQLQPGVLDDAPKTWIGALPDLPFEKKLEAQAELVRAFPNVSIVDVSATVERILGIVRQMGIAVFFMAVLSLAAGLAVLFSIARHEADKRMRDVALLKALGARFGQVRGAVAFEFAALGAAAAALGATMSILVAFVLTTVLFDRLYVFDPGAPLLVLVLGAGTSLATGLAATARSLRLKPRALLGRL